MSRSRVLIGIHWKERTLTVKIQTNATKYTKCHNTKGKSRMLIYIIHLLQYVNGEDP